MGNNANANPHVAKRVLEQLARRPMTYKELAAETGMPKGTIVTNVTVMVKNGVVIQDEATAELRKAQRNILWVFRLPAKEA
jgi:DNA-binding IclR family transcriptional regulator